MLPIRIWSKMSKRLNRAYGVEKINKKKNTRKIIKIKNLTPNNNNHNTIFIHI